MKCGFGGLFKTFNLFKIKGLKMINLINKEQFYIFS